MICPIDHCPNGHPLVAIHEYAWRCGAGCGFSVSLGLDPNGEEGRAIRREVLVEAVVKAARGLDKAIGEPVNGGPLIDAMGRLFGAVDALDQHDGEGGGDEVGR